ncbi:MAG: bifunctional demethylmenaquinone methyltransferase/2-methoxy-6-polyprenyl-1,4-benzoquinol methylase UbiE [Candidatus Marinimicrobia bacterium]|nr:bifunctional demethylmenaquinone methyltransferase/2-methoxy-6-polyprenyl-1,4-benzoquinol methylase UbiE [Candidatus Neomarinimicrobiota bacterium]|tara:strand:- start:6660 stop:7394 length:735 start_codon:yes stop_codon:yes gene_type:complete
MKNKYKHIGKDKKDFVQTMFDKISFKYDFFNHLATFYIDKYWRYQFIRRLNIKKGMNVLDIATGTGDVIIKICKKNENVNGFGFDCSQNMLEMAKNKSKNKKITNVEYMHGYAEKLPFESNSIDIVTISFGIRNFNNYEDALKEINRVLKPNGTLAILEFCRLRNSLFQKLFSFYFNNIIPIIGKILTGEKIFDYLPESVNNFFSKNELLEKIEAFGFKSTYAKNLTFGICSIVIGSKSKLINQ